MVSSMVRVMLCSDEVQKTIESRLREERANLEGKVRSPSLQAVILSWRDAPMPHYDAKSMLILMLTF